MDHKGWLTCSQKPTIYPNLSQNPIHILAPCFFKIHFILSSHLRQGFLSGSLRVFYQNFVYRSHVCLLLSPSIFLDLSVSIIIWLRVQIMPLAILQPSCPVTSWLIRHLQMYSILLLGRAFTPSSNKISLSYIYYYPKSSLFLPLYIKMYDFLRL